MKRLLVFGALLTAHLFGCQTGIDPKSTKSRVEVPTPTVSTAGVTIEYKVIFGLSSVEKVYVSLFDTPPLERKGVDGKDTVPDANGKGLITIKNIRSGRRYEYNVEVRHKDDRVPDTVFRGFYTIP